MDALKYSFHSAHRLMQELEDMMYDIRSEGPDGNIPPEFSILLAEIDERLHSLMP